MIRGYLADFYYHAAALVIEVDGPIHLDQAEEDAEREQVFTGIGLRVLRFTNDEIQQNPEQVFDTILKTCQEKT